MLCVSVDNGDVVRSRWGGRQGRGRPEWASRPRRTRFTRRRDVRFSSVVTDPECRRHSLV